MKHERRPFIVSYTPAGLVIDAVIDTQESCERLIVILQANKPTLPSSPQPGAEKL